MEGVGRSLLGEGDALKPWTWQTAGRNTCFVTEAWVARAYSAAPRPAGFCCAASGQPSPYCHCPAVKGTHHCPAVKGTHVFYPCLSHVLPTGPCGS
jgi:hypothetical protein